VLFFIASEMIGKAQESRSAAGYIVQLSKAGDWKTNMNIAIATEEDFAKSCRYFFSSL
jgi:hypothetical protein